MILQDNISSNFAVAGMMMMGIFMAPAARHSPEYNRTEGSNGRYAIRCKDNEVAAHVIPDKTCDNLLNYCCGDGWHPERVDNRFANKHGDGNSMCGVSECDHSHAAGAFRDSTVP